MTTEKIAPFIMTLVFIYLLSCSTPNDPDRMKNGKFHVDSLGLRIVSELHPDYQEMRGRAYLYLQYHFEDRPGRIERMVIAPNGVQPISVFSNINKCKLGPVPVDTIAGGSANWWFWSDVSYFDSLTVCIEFDGNYWDIFNMGDTCKVVPYGSFEWSTSMRVEVEN